MNELGKPILKKKQIKKIEKKTDHSRQIAGKKPPLTGLLHIGSQTEKEQCDKISVLIMSMTYVKQKSWSIGIAN